MFAIKIINLVDYSIAISFSIPHLAKRFLVYTLYDTLLSTSSWFHLYFSSLLTSDRSIQFQEERSRSVLFFFSFFFFFLILCCCYSI